MPRTEPITRTWLALAAAVFLCPQPGRAQTDPSGPWRTWQTEHFRIHAIESLSDVALAAAREAEFAYQRLAEELIPPSGRIDLVVADNVDLSNGITSVFPSNRVTVYVTPPTTDYALGHYDEWLRLVLTHELTHAFHLDRARGVWRVLRAVFGRAPGLFPNAYQPAWVAEGLATYYESRLSTAGRVRGSFHDQLIAAAARDGPWPRAGEANFANSAWPSGSIPYAWGSRFFQRQSAMYGDSVIPGFVERSAGQLVAINVSAPLKAAGGGGVDEAWAELRDTVRAAGDPEGVVGRGYRAPPLLRLSPDGTRLVHVARDGRSVEHLVVRDAATGTILHQREVNAVEGVTWVGDTVFVTQLDLISPQEMRSDLYRWEPGRSWRRLTTGARYTDVFPAPQGGVGVVALAEGTQRLVTLGEDGESPLPAPAADGWGRIAVAPDGQYVAAQYHHDGRWDIATWPAARPGRLFRAVSRDAAMDTDPFWTPAGDALLYSSERAGIPQIYVYRIATGETERLTDEPTGARNPILTPAGVLYYSTVLGDGFAIARRSVPRRLPSGPSVAPDPGLAPQAPPISAVEGSYRPWPALRPHYWMPTVRDEGETGVFAGVFTSGSDPIGRTAYVAFATVAPDTRRWESVWSLVHQRWRSWRLDFTAGQTWEYGGLAASVSNTPVPVSFRERSAEFGVRFEHRRWRSGLSARLAGFAEQDRLVNDGTEPLGFIPVNPTFGGGVLSASLFRVQQPARAISLENGASASGLYLRRWEVGGSRWSTEVRGAVNAYLALPTPGFAKAVLAGRVTAGVTEGPAATRYRIGGVSGDALGLVPGYSLGGGRRSFPMRGYDRGTDHFTRAFVAVGEVRIPLLAVSRGVWKLPLLIDRISATVFGEIGGGWNEGEAVDLASYRDIGGELVFDLGLGPAGALRARLGGAVPLSSGLGSTRGDARWYVTLGPSF